MNEKAMSNALYDGLTKKYPLAHVQRVESTGTGSGIPDINLCVHGTDAWIELKVAEYLKRTNAYRVKVRDTQIAWHSKRAFAGGKTYALIGIPAEKRGLQNMVLLTGGHLKYLDAPRDMMWFFMNGTVLSWRDWVGLVEALKSRELVQE